jgi:hypothetical protein
MYSQLDREENTLGQVVLGKSNRSDSPGNVALSEDRNSIKCQIGRDFRIVLLTFTLTTRFYIG